MARNTKKEYIKKIMNIKAPNGFKFDIANYLYNPSYSYDYPSFHKMIAETETTQIFKRIYYFKYHNGNGEYLEETFSRQKNGDSWQIVKERSEKVLGESNRFNINKLLEFCSVA